MDYKIVLLLVVCVCAGYSKRLPLPPYIKACHTSDPDFNKCALQHGRDSIASILNGDKKYSIPKLNPLVLPSVTLGSDQNFNLVLTDLHLYDFEGVDLRQFTLVLSEKKISVNLYFDKLNIIGKYDINGKILVLPIQGNGDINITADGLDVTYDLIYESLTKDGDEYIKASSGYADFTLKRAYFKLDNLFNGNKELGASTNQVLNDEWEKFIETLKPAITETVVTIANSIVNGITANVPYKEILPE